MKYTRLDAEKKRSVAKKWTFLQPDHQWVPLTDKTHTGKTKWQKN
jgi:hypothetical protein